MKKIKVPQYKYEGKLGSVNFKNLIIYLDDEDVENINLELILKKKMKLHISRKAGPHFTSISGRPWELILE